MRANRSLFAKLCLLTALAVPVQRSASAALFQEGMPQAPASTLLLAQATGSELPFTPPASLEAGETLLIDGSSSMRNMNAALTEEFQARYDGAEVDSAASGSDIAIDRLLNNEIDLAAMGRPLTDEEAAAGLNAVAIAREKIAIVVGPDNPYDGDITFEQFGQIFRGEITDWSELGGEPGPIRFVDRPEFSDTRQAFRPYPVFQAAPFETGVTADPVGVDETDAVIEALGSDGIGYAIANQVINNDDVTIISMHKTLPDDPAYPFSQPRSYVYSGDAPSAAAQGFLGVATGVEGQAAIADVRDAEGAASVELDGPRPSVTSPDGSLTATTNEENLAIIENNLGELVAGPLAGAGGAVTALAFSDNGETLATGSSTGNVRFWDAEGNPKGEAFSVTGNDTSQSVTSLSFNGNDEILASSEGRQGLWGLDGLPPGGAAAATETAEAAATAETAAAGAVPVWLWLLPLLGIVGAGLWILLGKKRKNGPPEAIRQTAPTATVPPPATDPQTNREVSSRAQTVISTDRVTDESRALESPYTSLSAESPQAPLPVGLPGLNTESDSTEPDLPLYESTDLESPDLEGTNLDLLTPTVAGGVAAAAIGGGAVLSGLSAELETEDDDDGEWDDNLDLTLDDAPPTDEPAVVGIPAVDTPIVDTPTVDTLSGDLWDTDTAEADAATEAEADPSPVSEQSSEPVISDIDSIEPTRGTVIAETETIPDMEPTRETIIGDSAVIFGEAAPVGDADNDQFDTADTTASPLPSAAAAGIVGTAIAFNTSPTTNIDMKDSSSSDGRSPISPQSDSPQPMPSQPASLSVEELATVDDGLQDLPEGYGDSRIVLLPRDPKWAYAYWDVSNDHKEELRKQGGQRLMLRLYDVTDIDQSSQAPHSMQQQDCHEMARSWYLEVPVSDRDYVAELGYLTADDRWLSLTRSAPIRVPPIFPSDWVNDQFATISWQDQLAGRTFGNLGRPGSEQAVDSAVVDGDLPRIYDDLFALTQGQNALRVAGSLYGSMHMEAPGGPGALSPSGSGAGLMFSASGLNVSGLNMSGVGIPTDRKRNFWLVADAELIVYGATEPTATLTIGDRVVPLNPDGTFRFHVSFPDGHIDYPIKAVAEDGEQTRSITLKFERDTPERNTNTKAEAKDEWF